MIDVHGFGFVEFTANNIDHFHDLFTGFGFTLTSGECSVDDKIRYYRQGDIVFIVNNLGSFETNFTNIHGPSVCSFSFIVDIKPKDAIKYCMNNGAIDASPDAYHDAIEGIGGSRLYFMTENQKKNTFTTPTSFTLGGGYLTSIDHLTNNVYTGNMDKWAEFYEKNFGFEQLHYFKIHGKETGLRSRAMSNGIIAIPINEDEDDTGQIALFLKDYNGEGVQHIALLTENIYESVEIMRENGIKFLDVPDTYYDMVDERIPNHGEDLERLQKNKILIDGNLDKGEGLLLQIFTEEYVGPIFFEIIQRKGNKGFGEGNFKALFESIEQDKLRQKESENE